MAAIGAVQNTSLLAEMRMVPCSQTAADRHRAFVQGQPFAFLVTF